MASIHIIPHATSSANTCINRLRLIDAAANQFALEKGLKPGDEIKYPDDLWPYLGKMHDPMPPYELFKNSEALKCPSGGIYHISKVGEKPTCSLGTTGTPAHVLH